MIDALLYEWTRIRTIRSTWWLSIGAVVAGVGISTLFSWAAHHEFSTGSGPSGDDLDGLGPVVVTQLAATGQIPSVVAFVLAIIGIFAWGHEYRHGMIRASLTALSSRTRFWVAKYLVVGAWVAVWTFVVTMLSGVVALVFLHEWITVFSGQTWSIVFRTMLMVVLLTWLAMAFTSLTRSQAFALVAIFLWPLLVESLINVFFNLIPGLRDHDSVLRFLPFSASRRIIDAIDSADGVFSDPLSPVGGVVVFGGLTAALMVVSYMLFVRRDA